MSSDSETSISGAKGESEMDLGGAAGLAAAPPALVWRPAPPGQVWRPAPPGQVWRPTPRRGRRRRLEGAGHGKQRQPLLDIDLGERHMAFEGGRLAFLQRQRPRRRLAAHRHLEVGDGQARLRVFDVAIEGEIPHDRGVELGLRLAARPHHRGDEVGERTGRHREMALHVGVGAHLAHRALEVELAARHRQAEVGRRGPPVVGALKWKSSDSGTPLTVASPEIENGPFREPTDAVAATSSALNVCLVCGLV